jgi:hypothetical protein
MVNKFIIHTLYFTITFGLIFMAFEILLRNIPNNYMVKESFIEKKGDKIEALVLGSSHAFHGVNPDFIKVNTLNAANGSQSIKYDRFLFEKVTAKAKDLKYVILTISYPSLSNELENSIENWRIKNYVIYHHYKGYPYTLKYHSEVINGQLYMPFKSIINYYLKDESEVGCTESGFFKMRLPQENLEESARAAALRHTLYNASAWKENSEHIGSILNTAKARNMKVIILSTPVTDLYYARLDQQQISRNRSFCDSLLTLYPQNLRYMDLQQGYGFQQNDFFDADHLAPDGATKLSLKLDSLITVWK